jgi:hypothetical protein
MTIMIEIRIAYENLIRICQNISAATTLLTRYRLRLINHSPTPTTFALGGNNLGQKSGGGWILGNTHHVARLMTKCCAECGKEEERGGGVSLKACKSCMQVKYCNAACQHKHWPKHKIPCRQRVAELREEALFKDPPAKEDCPICFVPMPNRLICCVSLPPATISSVPIYDFAEANEELAEKTMERYYTCCGKSICRGCLHSFFESRNKDKCPFCNAERMGKTAEDVLEEMMRRAAANDAASINLLAGYYYRGQLGLQQDHAKAIDLYTRAAELGCSKAHNNLGDIYYEGGNLKKAKFHLEASAMAGHEEARYNLGIMECNSGNVERTMKHLTIGASAGDYHAMNYLRIGFEKGHVSRESIDSTLAAYNSSCAEMRSEARDASIHAMSETI